MEKEQVGFEKFGLFLAFMIKFFVFTAVSPFILLGCSPNSETPEVTAKVFVSNYFAPDQSDKLLKITSDTASKKLLFEYNKPEFPDFSATMKELPSGFYLSDSSCIDNDHYRFIFSIQYSGNLLQKDCLHVFVKRYGNEWKISDYRFAKDGD